MASEWAIQMADSVCRRMQDLGKSARVEVVEPLAVFARDK